MEIKGDKHRHDGYNGWHSATQNHKADLHSEPVDDTQVEENTPEVKDEIVITDMVLTEVTAVKDLPEPVKLESKPKTEKSQGRQDLVKNKEVAFLNRRAVNTDVSIPDDAEWLYFKFLNLEPYDEKAPNKNVPDISWHMVLSEDIGEGNSKIGNTGVLIKVVSGIIYLTRSRYNNISLSIKYE